MDISRRNMELATALTTAAVGGLICYGSLENGIGWASSGPEPGYFPFAIGCLVMLGSFATVGLTLWRYAGAHDDTFIDGERMRRVAAFFLPIIVMVAVSHWLGLYIGMGLYTFYAMRVSAGYRTPASLAISLVVVLINFFIFETLFMVPLLKGPILEYFGIY